MIISSKKANKFKKIIWDYYVLHKRHLPWRETRDPYRILVSEVMLQQTQVSRVLPKYKDFLKKFPNFKTLAKSQLRSVLQIWQGLGYNRRALYLKQIAQVIVDKHNGTLPEDPQTLQSFPGIGEATSGALLAFAFNKPAVFIETNIRRCFIHFFFRKELEIHDQKIQTLLEGTLDYKNPREWYYALMDYGAMLGRKGDNPNKRSVAYFKQTPFENSNRQLRGAILKQLLQKHSSRKELLQLMSFEKEKVQENLLTLAKEGIVVEKDGIYFIK